MAHLSEGALRRLYDEPHALVERDRAHYNSCPECQQRFSAVADDARQGRIDRFFGVCQTHIGPSPRNVRVPAPEAQSGSREQATEAQGEEVNHV